MLTLLDIQRMSSEDGPGLRTTAFLKGCTLACAWCHNPESIASKGEVLWHVSRCMGCASCVAICPEQGIRQEAKGLTIERTRCRACFSCVAACPTGAVEAKGKPIEVEELARELLKDRAYFGEDGGITISGGEALHQPESIELRPGEKPDHFGILQIFFKYQGGIYVFIYFNKFDCYFVVFKGIAYILPAQG